MLWAIYFWIVRRYTLAGACMGFAGTMHLNYAVMGIGLSRWKPYAATDEA